MQKKLERHVVEYIVMNINKLFGNNKTSFMGVSILTSMPITIKLTHKDVDVPTSLKDLLHNNMMAYVKHGKSTVHFDFVFPEGCDVIGSLSKYMDSLLYIFIHEVLHVLYLDNTKESVAVFNKITDKQRMHNIAQDYRINLVVSDLFTDAGFGTPELNEVGLYDTKYVNMTAQAVLYDLLENADTQEQDNDDGTTITTVNNGTSTGELREPTEGSEPSDSTSEVDVQAQRAQMDPQALQQALAKIISTQAGSDSQKILGEEILKVSTDSSWFKKLEKKISNKLYLSTSGSRSTWSAKNMIYGSNFKAPANFSKKKTIEKLIIFIDQSGSVDDESLGRVVDIIDKNKKRIDEIEFHVFDTEIVSSLVTDDKAKMMKFVSIRQACGGTDMQCCWNYLEKLKPKEQKDSIVIMVSDNYCDHTPRPIHKKMHTYFVHAVDSIDVKGMYPNATCVYLKDK